MLNNIAALLGGALPEVGDYESIATVTVGSGGSTAVTFSSIPGTYKHLQIRGIIKTNQASASADSQFLQFNSDTTHTNYRSHYIQGSGSGTPSAGTIQSATYPGAIASVFPFNGTGQTSVFGAFVTDVLDYSSTNKNKTIRTLGGVDWNGAGFMDLDSGLWLNSASAVTSITFKIPAAYASGYQQHSSFALYGIK
jgi:hypothetical protein